MFVAGQRVSSSQFIWQTGQSPGVGSGVGTAVVVGNAVVVVGSGVVGFEVVGVGVVGIGVVVVVAEIYESRLISSLLTSRSLTYYPVVVGRLGTDHREPLDRSTLAMANHTSIP